MKTHQYKATVAWTGNLGNGTQSYQGYSRNHVISSNGKSHVIDGSSDPSFRGDPSRYNPEELFLSSLSSCHMLWFLHLCTNANIIVNEYRDNPIGYMIEKSDGSGQFSKVILHPTVVIQNKSYESEIERIHGIAHDKCFIANSCNFPIIIESR